MPKALNMSSFGLSGGGMVFTVLRAPVADRAGDCGHFLEQRLQETRDVGAGGQAGALPGPQRQEIRASCGLCRDRQMSDETARQSSREASCQAGVSRISA